jgi:hypothetical protein
MPKKRLPKMVQEYLRRIAKKGGERGGRARRVKLTASRRSEIARNAARARWAKRKRG